MTPPKARVATITGTFLAPGVSANRRLYTPEAIASAVEGMKAAIERDGLPLTMETGHPEPGAPENVLRNVGRITEVWQDEQGKGKFRADVPDTTAGRDLVALVAPGGKGENVKPYVGSVSIRGRWASEPRTETLNGVKVETADKLHVGHVDWTTTPGVSGARIESVDLFERAAAAFPVCESVDVDTPLREMVEGDLAVEEFGETTPAEDIAERQFDKSVGGGVDRDKVPAQDFAGPGRSFPIVTPKDVSDAATSLGRAKGDRDAIKAKIIAIAKRKGADFVAALPDAWKESAPVETVIPVDPDSDGDIDGFYCDQCGCYIDADARLDPDKSSDKAGNNTPGVTIAMSDAAKATASESGAATTPTNKVLHMSESDYNKAIAKAARKAAEKAVKSAMKEAAKAQTKASESAPAAEPVAEKAPAPKEQDRTALIAEAKAQLLSEMRAAGVTVPRHGHVLRPISDKPVSEMTESERDEHESRVWDAVLQPGPAGAVLYGGLGQEG